jgi:hypothetical protein
LRIRASWSQKISQLKEFLLKFSISEMEILNESKSNIWPLDEIIKWNKY